MKKKILCVLFLVSITLISIESLPAAERHESGALVIREQGSFTAGGTVVTNPGTFDPSNPMSADGQTIHGDHAYIFYQIPVSARKHPLVFLHGAGQFSKTWESTPDGREGFQNIFLRRGFGVYLVDQPRRGDAGRSTQPMTISAVPDDQFWYGNFRVGNWPGIFDGAQFPRDEESMNQFLRQMTPNTGPFDLHVISDALVALLNKAGKSILVTHSQGGGPGWFTAMKSENVSAIVAYEPGGNFVFPEGQIPKLGASSYQFSATETIGVPMTDFMKLTKMPIVIYYGDYIPDKYSDFPGADQWRVRLDLVREWAKIVNRLGGDATVVHLPVDAGIKGNTHFPFSDLNNIEIANILSTWLKEKGLD